MVSPAHAKVMIDTVNEPEFSGGNASAFPCFYPATWVQNAPVSGKVVYYKYTEGKFVNAMRTECAAANENALIGIVASEPPDVKIGVRLIAGVLARRIVPWVVPGDDIARGERISLIQFGSRCDVYLPRSARIQVKLGDKVVGGETVLAVLD